MGISNILKNMFSQHNVIQIDKGKFIEKNGV